MCFGRRLRVGDLLLLLLVQVVLGRWLAALSGSADFCRGISCRRRARVGSPGDDSRFPGPCGGSRSRRLLSSGSGLTWLATRPACGDGRCWPRVREEFRVEDLRPSLPGAGLTSRTYRPTRLVVPSATKCRLYPGRHPGALWCCR